VVLRNQLANGIICDEAYLKARRTPMSINFPNQGFQRVNFDSYFILLCGFFISLSSFFFFQGF
jgi:hypothetical protein